MLVLVFEVSECLASEVLVLDDVPDVLVFDDSEVLVFDDSDVRDFPLTPDLPSYFLPSARPGSATAIGIIAAIAMAAAASPARFHFTKNTPQLESIFSHDCAKRRVRASCVQVNYRTPRICSGKDESP